MKKRVISLLLCAAMLLSVFPVLAFGEDSITLVSSDGNILNIYESLTLSVQWENPEPASYQWQIQVSDDLWVNIQGQTGQSLEVTYAMIASLLKEDAASLRCLVNGEASDSFTVTMDYTEPELTTPAEAADPVILSGTTVETVPVEEPAVELPEGYEEAEANFKAAEQKLNQAVAALYDAQVRLDAAKKAYDELLAASAAEEVPPETEAPADEVPEVPVESEVPEVPAESEVSEIPAEPEVPGEPEIPVEAEVAPQEEILASSEAGVYSAPPAEDGSDELDAAKAELDAAQAAYDQALAAKDAAQAEYDAALDALNALKNAPMATMSLAMEAGTYADDPLSNYSVVINYQFENGDTAYDSYTASLAAGSSFNTTVTFPVIQGYLAYVNDVEQTTLTIDITSIQADVTYTVTYKPTNVNYTVNHYQQNLNDDQYTLAESETKQGLTNSQVPEVGKTYEGFYALLYERPNIAADGSTVVEVYYDRYYYLMNFDLDGGYGTEPIYARYDAPLGTVNTPTKAGYAFSGWTQTAGDTAAETLPAKMPAENRTYHAIWTADATANVTVVFWGENANDEEYSYIKSANVQIKPGTKFTYSETGSLICGVEPHTHVEACYAFTCTKEEHTHDADTCYTIECDITEHDHSNCTLDCTHHTLDCYSAGSYTLRETEQPYELSNITTDGFHDYTGRFGTTHYYLRLNGTWYCAHYQILGYWINYDEQEISLSCNHTHTDSCYTCGLPAHSHTSDCKELICTKDEHTHSDYTGECYTQICTVPEHTHNSECYMNGAGLDSNLWTFVKSDTVTVAADGSSVVNVYYDRVEKTLTFKYNYNSRWGYQTTETITAKWGSKISTEYVDIANDAGSTFWTLNDNGSGPYTNYFGVMPQNSATYYHQYDSGKDGSMTYWGEALNDFPGTYSVKLFEVGGVGGYYVSDEDHYEFEGFTYVSGTGNGESCIGAKFYYSRNSYTLTFNDGYSNVREESVKYEAPLSTYASYVPEVPSAYEPGSVTFGGWYLNPECTGAEYKLADHTMPADNILLYAKWVPVSHTVTFYLDRDAYTAGTALETPAPQTVLHGSLMEEVTAPTNGSYTFVGWFYLEDGVEKAFDPANMPVNKDLDLYGKWSSNVLKPYTIYYKIQNTDTQIADPTTGSGLAGITKTFEAKGGEELYADYQEGYFPLVQSHSLTIDIDATEENDTNVFTFWYVQKDAVPYIVRYVNAETGEELEEQLVVADNRKAVVTEKFKPISGYMPDAYQKRLVVTGAEAEEWITVTVDGAEVRVHPDNVLTFYYTEDNVHAYYKITHYTENLALDAQGNRTWTEYVSSEIIGEIGQTYTAEELTIPGFTFDATVDETVQSGELTAEGLDLKLYYVRNEYPYQVQYLEYGTNTPLHAPKDGTGKFGQIVSESAVDIEDYQVVGDTSKTLNIQIEEDQTPVKNIIVFYYEEKEVTINYEVVGPDGCGTVDPVSETVKVKSGTAQGSTAAAASEDYIFVGWYADEDCTIPVDSALVSDNHFTPAKVNDKNVAATYYAKFEEASGDLTIQKRITEGSVDQSFLFVITCEGNAAFKMEVIVPGNGSVTIKDLPSGNYTVTEITDWSWRYDIVGSVSQTVKVGPEDPTVTFKNKRTDDHWLDGSDSLENVFDAVQTATGE